MDPYIVYIKVNESNYITSINSSAFITDTDGWIEIDSGFGDKYHHAQGNYFSKSIITIGGAYRYKLVDGIPVECTEEEIKQQEELLKTIPSVNMDSRVSDIEDQLAILLGVNE